MGFTIPGTTIVCGDSPPSTHGAFGSLAFGIGTSEVEHVLATQTLIQTKPKNLKITIKGKLNKNVTSKDLILKIISQIGTAAGTGHVIEFFGPTVSDMTMEERMTLCNMSIEAGAKAGMIAPDEKTFNYLNNLKYAPKGKYRQAALIEWKNLYSDTDAFFDKEYSFNIDYLKPHITWGTSPEDGISISEVIPSPEKIADLDKKKSMQKSLDYMGLTPGKKLTDFSIQKAFIGSCTNGRIEALIVPGSGIVKEKAEQEGIKDIFVKAGFQWREPGCSMCLGMNPDQLKSGERCASTSNRNFEGRQGRGGRTHLVSPITAAASAIKGYFVDVTEKIT